MATAKTVERKIWHKGIELCCVSGCIYKSTIEAVARDGTIYGVCDNHNFQMLRRIRR